MRFSVIAAVVLAATLSSVAARADYHYGPVKDGRQCWKISPAGGGVDFGYWGECAKPAAVHRQRHG
jgi:hypothetical protein